MDKIYTLQNLLHIYIQIVGNFFMTVSLSKFGI